MNPIAGAFGLYLLYLLYSSNKAEIKANAIEARIVGVDADLQSIRITINIDNPTTGNIVVRSIFGNLFIDRANVATVRFSGYTVIPSNGSNTITITGEYIAQNLGKFLYNLFNGRQTFEIAFSGTMNVNNEMIPTTFKMMYGK
jgi:LEA14-like dessication related protein